MLEAIGNKAEPPQKVGPQGCLRLRRCRQIDRKALVDLARYEAQHFYEAVASQRSRRRKARCAVRYPREDRYVLRQHLAVVQHQGGHISFRVDVGVEPAAFQLLGRDIHLHDVKLQPCLEHRDVIGKAAESRRTEQLHGSIPPCVLTACILQAVC
jgi:hypothetical protein